jgi:hypothetical protein
MSFFLRSKEREEFSTGICLLLKPSLFITKVARVGLQVDLLKLSKGFAY